ncbi:hypothetical protein FN846DRAFT_18768 [Sphaerosporella brunnea]|uniref:Uncharacterized protein n=1 Tax=Sphaerosporella brunnea TaxID=1250544 RepID=A0A5J5EVP3_9PEZI|nr:hypothetical protein FN846DRAFT_18768 [Sphaerosporella brunnea]
MALIHNAGCSQLRIPLAQRPSSSSNLNTMGRPNKRKVQSRQAGAISASRTRKRSCLGGMNLSAAAVNLSAAAANLSAAAANLSAQPDFKGQHSRIEEIVEDAGHLVMFYQKFHCELN